MKKVILWFIILIILAGVGFYFGWVNVNPGTFCVAHSTLTGTIDYPLESGHIYWFWQKLIPKSFQVFTIQKNFYTATVDSSFPLPGSNLLSEYGNFELKLRLETRYKVDFEGALELFNNGILDDIEYYIKNEIGAVLDETVSDFMVEELSVYASAEKNYNYRILENLKENLIQNVQNRMKGYNLKEVTVNLSFISVPQLQVYLEALRKYLDQIQTMATLKQEELKQYSQYNIQEKEREIELERLREYGELIREYPEILKYLYIQKFGERAEVIVIPQDEQTGYPRMLEPFTEKPEMWLQKPPPTTPAPAPSPEIEKQKVPEAEEELVPQPEAEKQIEPEEEKKWYDVFRFWKFLSK